MKFAAFCLVTPVTNIKIFFSKNIKNRYFFKTHYLLLILQKKHFDFYKLTN